MSQKGSEDKKIKVTKLSKPPLPALKIQLTSIEELDQDSLIPLCKQMYTGRILKPGFELWLPFCGKTVNLTILALSHNMGSDSEDLSTQLEKLDIKDDSMENYFLIVDRTEWEILNKSDTSKNQTKEIRLSDIGGYQEVTKELIDTISHALKPTSSNNYFSSTKGILLYGPNGVGKTYITEAVINEVNAHVVQVNSGELFSKFFGETELRLRKLFEEAKSKCPSIIVLDNVDTLCSKRGGTEQERRVTSYLLTLIDSLKDHRTVVLATTSQLNLIDPSLRRPGRLDCEIEISIPSVADRIDILNVLLARWSIDEADIRRVAQAAHGYVAADLQCLVTKAVMQAHTQGVETSHLYWALAQIKPSAMREVQVMVPNVKWTDIGGMDELKLKLQQTIEWPLRYPESFVRLGISPPRGVLMYGPPGCSKTMIAKALATESKLNFLSIKGSELFSKWVGESEKAVQALFKKARAVAPSIIFLDELDALGGERSGAKEGSNVQERVLAQLLTEMDGVEPLGNVNIVAATNRPDRIDKALLRPGRLDRLVYVPLPDLATRICILQLQLVKMPVASDIVIDDLALRTEGYSGAEVIAVCHEAAMNALQEDFSVSEVKEKHFTKALETLRPRTPASLLQLYETYKK
ncbi:ribosome biogenesis protein SPATA5 isoform X2 [Macrosteles quadrilineatus]|nr:ribosome biogenesis protein SPATA5 isoform X2 [Macrosteles quadrilineatus]